MQIGRFLALSLMAGLLLSPPAFGGQKMEIEKIPYFNQPNCYKITNGDVEVVVTTDIGPRIIRYAFVGGENMLAELDSKIADANSWQPFGGHRLWHAPEVKPRSYAPDNTPIKATLVGEDSIRLNAPAEASTGIEKEILVQLHADGHVTLTHTLTNKNPWAVELSVWGLTIVNGGGATIIPNEPFIPHGPKLLPARPMVLWHFTDLSDPRWTLGKKFVRLHTDEKLTDPQKVGVANKQGWAGYLRKNTLFVKTFPYIEGANYPDYGCNCETYTAGAFMEVESLGPLTKVEPGKSAVNTEEWFLFKEITPGPTDDTLEAALTPVLQKVRGK